MPIDRFYVEASLQKGQTQIISGSEFDHMRVMRIEEGDSVELVNGKGLLATAHITQIQKKQALVDIESIETSSQKVPSLILALSHIRLAKLEWVIEKGTELGVDAFWLFPAEGSEKDSFSENQRDRLKFICISALKQSGRLFLPEIKEFLSIKALPNFEGRLFFGDVHTNASSIIEMLPHDEDFLFYIGPEKGFSEKETTYLIQEKKATGVKLSENILRAETAAIAACAIIRSFRL